MAVAESPRTEDFTFGGTWPFEPRWLETDGVHLHYVDEGPRDGQPVVFVHGTPTWSYLWRNVIPPLVEAGYRCVAHDELGFGRSEKPARQREYSLERHISHLGALVDELGLRGVTLVVHDWGGPIGLGWAVDHPELVKRLVVLNTGSGYVPAGSRPPLFYRLVRAPLLGDVLTRGLHVFRLALFHLAPTRLGPDEQAAYSKPHPSWRTRAGVAAAPRMIPWDERNRNRPRALRTEDRLGLLAGKPTLICWGMRDPVLRPPLMRHLRRRLGQCEVRELKRASHFVPEDAPDDLVRHTLDFLERTR